MSNYYISKFPLVEYDPYEEDVDSECAWDNYSHALTVLVTTRFKEHCIKVSRDITRWNGNRYGGYKCADCIENGEDLMNCIFPRGMGESHVYVYSYRGGKGLALRVTHHDNPVNGDWYYVVPVKQSTVDRYINDN